MFFTLASGWLSCAESGVQLVSYPSMKDVNLSNGLRVLLAEHHEQKTISYRMLVMASKVDEPAGKEGIAGVTAQVLQEGTKTRTSDQIENEVAGLGSSIAVSLEPSYVIFAMDLMSEYSQQGMDLFADVILNPSFPKDGIRRVKRDMLNAVLIERTDNKTVAANYGRCLLFGCDNPLGRTATEKSIKSISGGDIRNFYQRYYCAANSILLVTGDFSSSQMLEQIKAYFGKWQRTEIVGQSKTKAAFEKAGRMIAVNKRRMTQAVMYFNQWAPAAEGVDYYAYQLANYILGGGDFSSRLLNAARAKGGKTYHISSRYSVHADYGVLSIITSTRNEELYNTYQIVKREIERLHKDGISQEELQKAKNYFSGAVPLELESPMQIASKILRSFMQGFDINELSQEVINYDNVTVEQANAVIRKYMKFDKLNLVVVCDESEVRQQLRKIGRYDKANYKTSPCKCFKTKDGRI